MRRRHEEVMYKGRCVEINWTEGEQDFSISAPPGTQDDIAKIRKLFVDRNGFADMNFGEFLWKMLQDS